MIPLHDDNPTRIRPVVTVSLIVVCTLVFLWEVSLGPRMEAAIQLLGAVPAYVTGQTAPQAALLPPWATLITAMFLHGGWMHLIGNMLYLWIFGNNVEDAMGHGRFLLFYLLCGLAASLAHVLLDPRSPIPMVGASGAISGVLGAYLLLYPFARVLVAIPLGFFIYTFWLPAAVVLGLWFLIQIAGSLSAPTGQGGVAWMAHLGGFVAGMVLVLPFKRKDVSLWNPPHSH